MKFRFRLNDGQFELTFNDKVYGYKALANNHKVFIDGSELIVKFRVSEKINDDTTEMLKILTGELWYLPEKSKSK